jgi:hypothetical protein
VDRIFSLKSSDFCFCQDIFTSRLADDTLEILLEFLFDNLIVKNKLFGTYFSFGFMCKFTCLFSFPRNLFYKDEELSELDHLCLTPRLISRSVENLSSRSALVFVSSCMLNVWRCHSFLISVEFCCNDVSEDCS